MELKAYWRIVLRRWWIVVLLPLLVGMGSLALRKPPEPVYQASMRLTVGIAPEPRTGDYYTYDQLYTWQTAEYLADDFSEIVKSQAFADDVNALLAEDDIAMGVGAIQGFTPSSAATRKQHRILTVTVTGSSPESALAIAGAAARVLEEQQQKYFAQLQTDRAQVHLIDPPALVPSSVSLRERLDIPLRVLLALAAGVGLAFLLDNLDGSIRSASELEAMGISVLAELPPKRRWPWLR
jgi:capsular polysaccharide biosynthesis protein